MPGNEYSVLSLYASCGGGGVIQVFRNHRSAAGEFGVDSRWLGCGVRAMEAARQDAVPGNWGSTDVVGPVPENDTASGRSHPDRGSGG